MCASCGMAHVKFIIDMCQLWHDTYQVDNCNMPVVVGTCQVDNCCVPAVV